MIAQWKNECISLSVLSMARVMIAQWENECIPLSVLSVGHDSSVREWTYLTVRPLRGPGHDSSVREWTYLTVCPLRGPGHDSSVGEWTYLTFCALRGQGSIPNHDRVFRGTFLANHTLQICTESWGSWAWQKMAQSPLNDTTSVDNEEEGPSHWQWLKGERLGSELSSLLIPISKPNLLTNWLTNWLELVEWVRFQWNDVKMKSRKSSGIESLWHLIKPVDEWFLNKNNRELCGWNTSRKSEPCNHGDLSKASL